MWQRTRTPGVYRDPDREGRFRIVVNLGRADGRRQRVVRHLTGTTLQAAEHARTALLAERDAGRRRPRRKAGTRTVGEWVAYYLETYKRPRVLETTHERYLCAASCHILPTIGHMRLDKLAPDDVQEFYNALGRLSSATQVQTAALLKAALAQAVRSGHIPANPAAAVDNPRRQPQRRPPLPTIEQVRVLLRAMADGRCDAYEVVRFALETGLRQGEATALEWSALDLEDGVVYVRRTTAVVPNPDGPGRVRVFRERAKTPASEAGVYLPPTTTAWLRGYRRDLVRARTALAPRYWTDIHGNLVFPCRRVFAGYAAGRAWDGSALRKALRRYCHKTGIPDMNFHDCRRLFVSAAAQRVPLVTVRDMARHADLDTTANVYARASEADLRAGAQAIDGLWAH